MRKKCKYTQKQVADLLGLDRSTYSYYELGKIKPDISTIMKLSEIFGVHYTTILEPEDKHKFLDINRNIMAYKSVPSEKKLETPNPDNLTKEERDVLMAFRLLSEKSRTDAMEFISKKFKGEKSSSQNNEFEVFV